MIEKKVKEREREIRALEKESKAWMGNSLWLAGHIGNKIG